MSLPPEYLNQIVTGDARELAAAIPDGSVDLVFTDPVYDRIEDYYWLGREAARVLKPDSAALVWLGIGYLLPALTALAASGLRYRWQAVWYQTNRIGSHADMGFCLYSPFVWLEKGRSRVLQLTQDVTALPFTGGKVEKFHGWNKQPAVIRRYLAAFTEPGAFVWDPFCGGGTVPAACKQMARNYIASEIDPETATLARERVRNTPMPLPLEFAPDPQPALEFAA